jgi:hypothetical protein
MTALEWFLRHVNIGGVKQGHGLSIDEVKEQALEMEKQQHEETFEAGYGDLYTSFEEYYSETYKKDNI